MSSGESTQSTQTQQVNQIPQWVTQAGQQNYAFAQNVANQPLTQYQGQMVAGTSPQTQQAWNLAAGSGNVGQDQYGASQAGFLNSLGQTPQAVTDPGNARSIRANQLSSTDLSPYTNPFTQSVINATMPVYQQALGQQQVGNQNQASGANAFGGSRMGVQQGVTQAQGAQGMAQMASGLNQANFQQAQAAAQGDVAARNQIAIQNQQNQQANLNRNLTAQTTNQGAAQAKINSDILASQGLANLGDSQQKANAANFTMLTQAGAAQQGQGQDQINAQMAKFTQANQYPQQQLATLLSALGMTPHDTATTGTSNSQQQTPTNWGALALGGLQDLSGFFKASKGTASVPKVPGALANVDSVPSLLTPGEAVLTKEAATKLGRDKIKRLNAGTSKVRRYAGGTSDVQPDMQQIDKSYFQRGKVPDDLAGIADPTPFGMAGLKALIDRGYAYPHHYAGGTSNVAPDMDDAELGSQIEGGGSLFGGGGLGGHLAKALGEQGQAAPQAAEMPKGWNAPSQGFFVSGFAEGTSNVQAMSDANRQGYEDERRRLAYGADPARGLNQTPDEAKAYDAEMNRIIKSGSVPGYGPLSNIPHYAMGIAKVPSAPKIPGALASAPAMLTPGEAILNQQGATKLGRKNIAAMNMGTPPSSPLVAGGLKSMGPRTLASFMPPKRAFGAATTAIRGGAKSLGGLSNTKVRGALA